MQSITELNDSLSNLIFNRKTIERNRGLRGVIFKETRYLISKIDNKSRLPQWEQLLNLIDDMILDIELEIEQIQNKNESIR